MSEAFLVYMREKYFVLDDAKEYDDEDDVLYPAPPSPSPPASGSKKRPRSDSAPEEEVKVKPEPVDESEVEIRMLFKPEGSFCKSSDIIHNVYADPDTGELPLPARCSCGRLENDVAFSVHHSNHPRTLEMFLEQSSTTTLERMIRTCPKCICWVCDSSAEQCKYWTSGHFLAVPTNNPKGLWYHAKFSLSIGPGYIEARVKIFEILRAKHMMIGWDCSAFKEKKELLLRDLTGCLSSNRSMYAFENRAIGYNDGSNTPRHVLSALVKMGVYREVIQLYKMMGVQTNPWHTSTMLAALRCGSQIMEEDFFRSWAIQKIWSSIYQFTEHAKGVVRVAVKLLNYKYEVFQPELLESIRKLLQDEVNSPDFQFEHASYAVYLIYEISEVVKVDHPGFGPEFKDVFLSILKSKPKLRKIVASLWN
jgi:hypothetical protein